jgi:hypothetical protein
MAKGDRTVYRDGNGKWVNKRNDAEKAASLHKTQAEAEKTARAQLKNSGGGELTTMGRDGKIRSKDTIPPAKDHCPPKDKEH